MSDEDADVNPDGSTTFGPPPVNEPSGDGFEDTATPPMDSTEQEEAIKEAVTGVDPAIYLLVAVVLVAVLYYVFVYRRKATAANEDDFFTDLDGEKFNLNLPGEVDEYYAIKEKCEAAGWKPGQAQPEGGAVNSTGPSRVLAQALMKRAIADIPVVQHIQKQASGMNKLYSQSMCSANQWRAYQAAEAMVSAEVEDVRAEADQVEPGWSQMIWRQAMQYHTMLKQKHVAEAKAVEEEARKRKEIEERVKTAQNQTSDKDAQEKAAAKAAEELIKMEEREKESKKSFTSGKGGIKKGFLETKGKKKK